MSRKYKFHDNEEIYFVTFTVVRWVDLFTRNEYKDILIDSLNFCKAQKDLDVYAYCFMTNHIHLIIGSRSNPLSNIVRDFKRYTSEQLRRAIVTHPKESRRDWMLHIFRESGIRNNNNYKFQLWQQHSHPIALISSKILHRVLNYIHDNPVKAGFVQNAEDWLYSSANQYSTSEKGLIDIIQLDPMLITT